MSPFSYRALPSCQPETGAKGEDAKRFRGVMLSTFTPSKTSEPAKSISLSKNAVFPTNTLFSNFFMRPKFHVEVTR